MRAVFIRAPWVEEHGDGVEVLARGGRPPGGRARGRRARRRLPPRAVRRATAFTAGCCDARWAAAASAPRGGRREGPARRRARLDPRPLLDRVQKGDVCVIQSHRRRPSRSSRRSTRRSCAPAACPVLQLAPEGAAAGVLRARLRRAARLGPADRDAGRPRTPTCGSRSWPTSTRASCPGSTRSASRAPPGRASR